MIKIFDCRNEPNCTSSQSFAKSVGADSLASMGWCVNDSTLNKNRNQINFFTLWSHLRNIMLTAGDDELTSYGSACIAIFFVFICLGVVAGYITQVWVKFNLIYAQISILKSKKSGVSADCRVFKMCQIYKDSRIQLLSPSSRFELVTNGTK